jgi:hypothetical protein
VGDLQGANSDRPTIEAVHLTAAPTTSDSSAQTVDASTIKQAQTNLNQTLEQLLPTFEQASVDRKEKLEATISAVNSLLEALKKLN